MQIGVQQMVNYLAIVQSDEEAKKHALAITTKAIGFPNVVEAEKRLFDFFKVNQHFLFATQIFLDDGIELETIKKVLRHFGNNFGPYFDNFMGFENFFANIPLICKSSFIDRIDGAGKAYIVGAGPSLDDTLYQLKEVVKGDYGVIIACDAVLKRLLKEGIKPHIVVTAERTPDTKQFFEGIDPKETEGILLLANVISHPTTLECWPHELAFYCRAVDEYRWLIEDVKPQFDTTPFVTQTSIRLALASEMSEVILVGQDFAYGLDGKSHANLLLEDQSFHQRPHDGMFEVPGVRKGSKVKTTQILNSFAIDLEILIKEAPKHVTFINCSPTGRKIRGTVSRNLTATGFRACKGVAIKTKPFPLTMDEAFHKAKEALLEFTEQEEIEPSLIETFPHISKLGYHFLIQAFVYWQSLSWSEPERLKELTAIFNNTYKKVREDLSRILMNFLHLEAAYLQEEQSNVTIAIGGDLYESRDRL